MCCAPETLIELLSRSRPLEIIVHAERHRIVEPLESFAHTVVQAVSSSDFSFYLLSFY